MHPGTQESPEHGDPVKYTALGNVVGELPSLGHDYPPAASTHVNKWCLPLQFLPIEFESQGTKSIQLGITHIQRQEKSLRKGPSWDQGPPIENSQSPGYRDSQLTREVSFSSDRRDHRGFQQHLKPGSDAEVSTPRS